MVPGQFRKFRGSDGNDADAGESFVTASSCASTFRFRFRRLAMPPVTAAVAAAAWRSVDARCNANRSCVSHVA